MLNASFSAFFLLYKYFGRERESTLRQLAKEQIISQDCVKNCIAQFNQIKNPKFPSRQNYMSKVNNRNTKTRCEIFSELTMKTPERRRA